MKNNIKYSSEEINKLFSQANFPIGLSKLDIFRILFWSLFKQNKFTLLLDNIKDGKSLRFAYQDVKELNKK